MANINTNPSGKVLTANGIVVLNNVSDVDPRKAVVFDSRQDALNGIDAAQGYNRVENLILYYKENGKTVAGIFDGGVADEDFIPFITDTSKWELIQENPYNLKVPTEAEWQAEIDTWATQDANGAFGSVLKLTYANERENTNGIISDSEIAYYWSNTLSELNSPKCLIIIIPSAYIGTQSKADGLSVRLIVEGTFTQQQYDDNYTNETVIINGLNYGFVYNPTTQRIWLDKNLGATQVATSLTDTNAYGDLFQWGRPADGHEKRDSNTTNVQATTPQPEHGDYIIGFSNWLTPSNDNLWQGTQGINNPAIQEKLIGKNGKKASYLDLLNKPNFDELAGFDYIQTESGIGVFYNQATGDVVNPVTGMLIFNVNNVNRPTIYDGTQWNGLSYEDVEQEIIVGGNYHDFSVTGNILIFTNTNARAVITGFNTTKYKKLILINNGDFEIRLENESILSPAENQIKLPNNVVAVGLEGTTQLTYIETINKWQITNVFGSRYMPEHKDLTQDSAVTVGLNSISKSREIINPKEIREDIDVAQTEIDLNTLYPNVPSTFQVICPVISKKYTKYSDLEDKWYEEDLVTL